MTPVVRTLPEISQSFTPRESKAQVLAGKLLARATELQPVKTIRIRREDLMVRDPIDAVVDILLDHVDLR
jgi:hypothetical protein